MDGLEESQIPPLSNLTDLSLDLLPKLSCIWEGPLHLLKLQNLSSLRVIGCSKLAYLFPSALAQSLVNLQSLFVLNCKFLEHVIIEEATENGDAMVSCMDGCSFCWQKLETLTIIDCGSLKYVSPITFAQGLTCLKSIQITSCSQLKQVFSMTKEKGRRPQQPIVLQRLRILKFQNLETLSSFCPENIDMSLSLKEFKVHNCPQLTRFVNQQEAALQAEFKDVPIYDSRGLSCNAKKVTMDGVMYHKNLIPNVHPQGLNETTFLKLEDGKGLECLIDTTDQGHASTCGAFFNLVDLDIRNMTGLEMLCRGPFPKGFLQKLEKLEIWSCMELLSLSPAIQNLKKVTLTRCEQLQQVFQMEKPLHDLEENQAPLLSNLTSFELKFLPELKWIWKGPCPSVSLRSLEVVQICDCKRLKYIFPPSLAQSLALLKELKIEFCEELEHIITTEPDSDHLHPPVFAKLTDLKIDRCPRLEYVFQIDLDKGLPNLNSLSITDASELKQVFINVAKPENAIGHAFGLPSLQHLHLEKLTNLSCFCSENYPIMSPSLRNLTVEACPALENNAIQQVNRKVQIKVKGMLYDAKELKLDRVISHKNLIPNIDLEWFNELTILTLIDGKGLECLIDTTEEGHVSTGGAFFNLVDLVIKNMTGFKMLCNGILPKGFLQKLKNLEIRDCMEMVSLSLALQKLETVRIIDCGQLQQVFPTEEPLHDLEENQAPLLSNLTSFALRVLPKLKWIWKGPCPSVCLRSLEVVEIYDCKTLKYVFPPSLAQSLALLKHLTIEFCKELEHIITPEPESDHVHPSLFPKLTFLKIDQCPRLEYVFQIDVDKGLPDLESLLITDAFELKQVFINVAKPENAIGHAFELPRLFNLVLKELVNLSCFCSENYPIMSPSLINLTVEACPALKNLAVQQINQKVQVKELELLQLKNDIHDAINCQMISQNKVEHFFLMTETITLVHINQLQGPIQVGSLRYLRVLMVSNCSRQKYLFSSVLVPNFPWLHLLSIKYCEELEGIIEMDQTSIASSSQGHLQSISFPSLECIRIYSCSNLKSLFPINVVHSLSKLERLDIQGVSKLEQVFGYQGEPNNQDEQKEIVLPDLKEFKLHEQPRLKSFAPMAYSFLFPSLHHFEVTKCPKLITSFSMDSKNPVHAITEEATQQVQDNTMEENVDNQSTCNGIDWNSIDGKGPTYMTMGETKIMIGSKGKIQEKRSAELVVDT